MNLLSKLEYQRGFSELEKQIADYLIRNKQKAANMNLKELSDATYISTATISRFCRKLGEKNYNDFRVHFASLTQVNDFSDVNFNKPFMPDDDEELIVENISKIYAQTIESTKQVLDMNQLQKAVDIIEKAPIIDVYGVGDSFLSCLMFEHKMTYVNKVVNLKIIPTEQNQRAVYSNKNTVAVIVSYSGETNEIVKIVERIKQNGGTVIAITSINNNFVRANADVILNMCSKENYVNKIAAYSSKISSDYIIDLLYSLLFKKHYHTYMISKVELGRKWDGRRNTLNKEGD